MTYLAYDIRGIQSFIFAVPRLRYIVGGSALIDRFDRETASEIAAGFGGRDLLINSGGGKGAFHLADEALAARVQSALVEEARRIGLDLRIRIADDYSDAALRADRLFPYLPEGSQLSGHPCPESGLYPVQDPSRPHEIIRKRQFDRGDRMDRWFEGRVLRDLNFHPDLSGNNVFFHDVGEDSKGAIALGRRNRWAIVCMDGNDIGRQFGHDDVKKLDEQAHRSWIKDTSTALDAVTAAACVKGINGVLREWLPELSQKDLQILKEGGEFTLPVRPLIVGGDDLTVLCHASHAMTFVREAVRAFADESRRQASLRNESVGLWPATGGELSISAGVLFAPTTLPLASAIPYAETLLDQAKQAGRSTARVGTPEKPGTPATAYVDWESVTEGLLDEPRRRRQRELVFIDGDDDTAKTTVQLTRRPYSIDELERLQQVARDLFLDGRDRLPGSIAHDLLTNLHAGRDDRALFYARLGKNHPKLVAALKEPEGFGESARWRRKKRKGTQDAVELSTDLIDAFLLAQEHRRMQWETAR